MKVLEIPLADLLEPEHPVRMFADEDKLNELADSIREDGLLQPLVVVPEGEKYRIVAGHRRFRACRLAGMTSIPCSVVEATVLSAVRFTLAENLAREDVSAVDLGYYYDYLCKTLSITQAELAGTLNRTPAHVSQLIGLTRLPQKLQTAVRSGELSYLAALSLGQIEDAPTRDYYTDIAVKHGASTPVVRMWVEEIRLRATAPPGSQGPGPEELPPIPELQPSWCCIWCDRTEKEVPLERVWICREDLRSLLESKKKEKKEDET